MAIVLGRGQCALIRVANNPQTWKFVRELGKHTDLRTALVLGGDSMDQQFAAIHENPDVIVATPGRLLHLVVEMDLALSAVEYVVFDECDRLFEMGFQEQIQELIGRLPAKRQTCLFSATLPKLLLEFAQAGLTDPTLVRLDVETKLSENLRCGHVGARGAAAKTQGRVTGRAHTDVGGLHAARSTWPCAATRRRRCSCGCCRT